MKPCVAERTALLVMDYQNYGVHPDGFWAERDPEFHRRLHASGAVANTAAAIAGARAEGAHVIYVVNQWREGHPDLSEHVPAFAGRKGTDIAVEGTWGVRIYDELKPQPNELIVSKRTISALTATDLDRLLRLRGIDTLVLTGIATNFVVEGTAREAADEGYRVVVLRDCCETHSEEMQRFSLETMAYLGEVVDVAEFLEALGSA